MPKLLTELTTDFRRGQVDNTAATRFPKDALALILNGRLEPDSSVAHRGGSERLHATALNSGGRGWGASSFVTAAGAVQFIVIAGDTAYKSTDYGASWSQIATGLREDYWDFAEMRVGASNYLYMTNGGSGYIQSWDGATWGELTNGPAGAKQIEPFNGRLYATGHSGSIVQASQVADPTVWASPRGLTLQILVASGGTPTGLLQIGAHLLVFDENQTSYIDGFGEQTIIVASGATGLSRSVGLLAFRSLIPTGDNGCCWLSKRGVEYYTPGSDILLLSRGITEYIDQIDRQELLSSPGLPSAVYDQTKEEYLLAVSTSGTRNDIVLRFSLRQRSQTHFGAPAVDVPISVAGSGILFLGGDDDYLTTGSGGAEFRRTPSGYVELVSTGAGGDPTADGGDGYLTTVVDNTMPSTIFVAPISGHPGRIHSIGYDGFVRLHGEGTLDDVLSDGTGGATVTMKIVSKPFFFGSITHEKKVRVMHVSSINDNAVTVSAGVRAAGKSTALVSMTIAGGALNHSVRAKKMISAKGDQPQLEVQTSDAARITLLGLSAYVLKERV
tara:strand:+ start:1790 stop:3460 length:1671 start_codon:yes stop_codon:yes gene_type:complete